LILICLFQLPVALWSDIQDALGIDDEVLHYIVSISWVLHLLEASYLTSRTVKTDLSLFGIFNWFVVSFILGFPAIFYYNSTAARSGTKTD
jgi:hypothetical protein